VQVVGIGDEGAGQRHEDDDGSSGTGFGSPILRRPLGAATADREQLEQLVEQVGAVSTMPASARWSLVHVAGDQSSAGFGCSKTKPCWQAGWW